MVPSLGPCWYWKASLDGNGYGRFGAPKPFATTAHRFMWELVNGNVPKGILVCHKCDEGYPPGDFTYRKCCNPDHLFLGTFKENTQDMLRKGRVSHSSRSRGSKHYEAKLTEEKVIYLRQKRLEGVGLEQLAAELGVTFSAVSQAAVGHTWKHVPNPVPKDKRGSY
jgi:hypothetical protein